MVEKAGGYYEAAFKEDRGVNQGDPIHPAIFQCGGGWGGATLGFSGNGKYGRAGREQTKGQT